MEIERKFLVRDSSYEKAAKTQLHTRQGYLSPPGVLPVVRVRLQEGRGFLTLKGATAPDGITRQEWEYEIPLREAEALLALAQYGSIDKVRSIVPYEGFTWEVDRFLSPHAGLILAEIELRDPQETPPLPPWVGEEVTQLPEYRNQNIAKSNLSS